MTTGPDLVDIGAANFDTLPCCGIKSSTHPGRRQKRCWLAANAELGLRAQILLAPGGRPCGYVESIPGEYAWRGVDAAGYWFLHCIWMHSKPHQRKGWGSLMVKACLDHARRAGMKGAAVMVRDGPWLSDHRLFLANGFELVDAAPPDFQLLARKFKPASAPPRFRTGWSEKLERYGRGLTILHSAQCPYAVKFASEIADTAAEEYGIAANVLKLESFRDAQDAPTPYASFAVIRNGRLLADHQISRTRFRNIMNSMER